VPRRQFVMIDGGRARDRLRATIVARTVLLSRRARPIVNN